MLVDSAWLNLGACSRLANTTLSIKVAVLSTYLSEIHLSIELRNWFKQRLGCEITVLDILGSSSIFALGQHTATLLKIKMASGG